MKNLFFGFLLLYAGNFVLSGQALAPYLKVTETGESVQTVSDRVTEALQKESFEVLGTYYPANRGSLKVIAFTREDLMNTVARVADRGALGAVLKVGLVAKDGKVVVSYTNPDYLLRAYLQDDYATHKIALEKVSAALKTALSAIGKDFTPFGGTVEAEKLKKYHYKMMMPYFTDPVTLGEYASFEEGLRIIEGNLSAKKGLCAPGSSEP